MALLGTYGFAIFLRIIYICMYVCTIAIMSRTCFVNTRIFTPGKTRFKSCCAKIFLQFHWADLFVIFFMRGLARLSVIFFYFNQVLRHFVTYVTVF